MGLTIVNITIGHDNTGQEVTECNPRAVTLSKANRDQLAWRSFVGNHSVVIEPDIRPRPLTPDPPWQGQKGEDRSVATVAENAEERFFIAKATLTLESGETIFPGGAIIIVKK